MNVSSSKASNSKWLVDCIAVAAVPLVVACSSQAASPEPEASPAPKLSNEGARAQGGILCDSDHMWAAQNACDQYNQGNPPCYAQCTGVDFNCQLTYGNAASGTSCTGDHCSGGGQFQCDGAGSCKPFCQYSADVPSDNCFRGGSDCVGASICDPSMNTCGGATTILLF